ncbi:tRNA lysidine(34) synthetase TilS [Devosia sp.]|uniref:tRNA lysidine(34) synthetase TilS n=1 Tax=Devosia sp. TaxID=1871048 RepID=UPI00326501F3
MSAGLSLLDDTARLEHLFAPAAGFEALALAVSGGADSLALLLLAARWAQGRQVRLAVYSVDHGLRPEAASEVAMVLAAASGLGLTARGLTWAGPHKQTGVQAAAREARYQLMGAAMQADGATLLLTAHHLQDQAETVLMRLAHGSGVDGLRGMSSFSSVEGVRIFRPLLDVDPDELKAVVAAGGLMPAQDPSNTDTHYERVRWRAMLPQLAELGLTARRLADFAGRAGQAQDVVALSAERAELDLVTRIDGVMTVAQAGFAELPQAVGVLLLSRLLAEVGGGRKSRAIGSVEVVQRALVAETAFRGRTLHGCQIRVARGVITLAPEPGRAAKAGSAKVMQPFQT